MNLLPRSDSLKSEYNPKTTYRPGQLAAVASLFGAIHDGYKYLALNAPTGSGKSIIATSLANLLGGSHILTTQIKLQEQYLELGDEFKRVLGRSNFQCIDSKGRLTCDEGRCLEGKNKCTFRPQKKGKYEAFNGKYWEFRPTQQCKYWKNVETGVKSKHTVFNYAYYVLKMNTEFESDFERKPLMILDEGHNLEGTVRNIASFEIHDFGLRYISPHLTVPKRIKECSQAIKWMEEILIEVGVSLGEFHLELDESSKQGSKNSKRKMMLSSLKSRLEVTIERYHKMPENWVFYRLETGIKLSPLSVSEYIQSILFKHSDVKIIMSATLPNKEVLCKRLGIKESDLFYYNMQSTFPIENSTIHTYAQPTMTWASDMVPKRNIVGKKIIEIMTRHKGRGLILTNSFDEVKYYENYISRYDTSQFERLTTHERGDKQENLLSRHTQKANSVLISPSMWEGVDLAGDLAVFQVITKVPYNDFKDPIVKGWKDLDPKRYFEDAAEKIRQGVGRTVRSSTDLSDIYILDGNFKKLYKYNQKEFPPDFTSRVI